MTSSPHQDLDTDARANIQHQETIAELGQRALEADSLNQFLHDASNAIGDTLDTEYVSIFELLPGKDNTFLREGIGWSDGMLKTTHPNTQETHVGQTLVSADPVVIDDIRTNDEYSADELFTDHDVVSGTSVVIGSAEDPWGVLGTYTTDRYEFTEYDITFLQNAADILNSAIHNVWSKRGLPEEIDDVPNQVTDNDQERIIQALETTGEGISLLDENGEFIYVNQAYAETYGYEPEELLGEHWEMLYPDGQEEEIYEDVLPELAEQGTWAGETIGLRKDGSTFIEDHRLATTAGREMVCSVRDMTTEYEQRRQLEEQEAALRETYEVISDQDRSFDEKVNALLSIGRDVIGIEYGSLSYVDDQDYRFEVVQSPDDSVEAGDVVPVSATNCERAIESQETLVLENVAEDAPDLADRAGNADWGISCYLGAPVFVGDDIYGTVCFYDKTPREDSFTDWQVTLVDLFSRWISYELERENHEQALEESNERLEQFAYAASHDLQEPLRMISSYLRLLEGRYGDALDEDGEEFLEFAVDGADRMREMIDALLEYARVETRGEPFEPVDLDKVLDEVLADLQVSIEESDAEIRSDQLPQVEGDASQLRQVFQNLLSNAITYSGDEPPQIDVSATQRGPNWVISIRDNGIGIDPDDQDRVFTVFDRLHSREEYEGTGIGLALCKRIIERHGGEIWVESDPGEGSTFSFTIPDSN